MFKAGAPVLWKTGAHTYGDLILAMEIVLAPTTFSFTPIIPKLSGNEEFIDILSNTSDWKVRNSETFKAIPLARG